MQYDNYIKSLISLDRPREIKIEITPRCNCNCYFCVNRATFAKKGVRPKDELKTKDILFILDKIKAEGISKVRLTGGEPMLREDFFDILKYAKKIGLKTIVNTNCTLIDDKATELLDKYCDIIVVSLISPKPEKTDEILGIKGVYEKKVKLLKELKNSKQTQLWACTVLTEENIAELSSFHNLAEELSIYHWFLLRQTPTPDEPEPTTKKSMLEALDLIEEFERSCKKIHYIGNAVPFCIDDKKRVSRLVYDGAFFVEAQSKLVVNPRGDVLVDYAVDEVVGNVFKDDFLDIWNRGLAKSLRSLEMVPEKCKECSYLLQCRGGSRFAAKIITGDYGAKDPLMG